MGTLDLCGTRRISANYSCVYVHSCMSEIVPATAMGLWVQGPYVKVPENGETGIQGQVLDRMSVRAQLLEGSTLYLHTHKYTCTQMFPSNGFLSCSAREVSRMRL